MNKKSTYLIIALLFVIGALGWELLIKGKKTEKEQEEAKKEAEKIPEPAGQRIYEYSSFNDTIYNTGLKIGIKKISSGYIDCIINSTDNQNVSKILKVSENYPFIGNEGGKYIVSYDAIRTDNQNREYVIFQISRNNTVPNSNVEEQQQGEAEEKQQRYEDAISEFEKRINEKVKDEFESSTQKIELDTKYRNNWDESKTRYYSINKIEQYREKEKEYPQEHSSYDFYLTYFFKIYIGTPDGTIIYSTKYKTRITDDNNIVKIQKPDFVIFNKISEIRKRKKSDDYEPLNDPRDKVDDEF